MTAKKQRLSVPAQSREFFGSPHLFNAALAPVTEQARDLRGPALVAFWLAVALGPALYASAIGPLPPLAGWGGAALATACAALVMVLLARTPARFGLPWVVQLRTSFGAGGAPLVAACRWVLGVVWLTTWTLELGTWTTVLLTAALPKTQVLRLANSGPPWGAVVIGTVLVTCAWFVLRGGLRPMAKVATAALVVALVSGALLVTMAIVQGGAAIRHLSRLPSGPMPLDVVAAESIRLTVVLLAMGIAVGDFARGHKPSRRTTADEGRAGSRSDVGRLGPYATILAGMALPLMGLVVASASHVVSNASYGDPIADGAGLGGVLGGITGFVFALGCWCCVAPLLGLYQTTLALCGTWPRLFTYRRALAVTAFMALMLMPAMPQVVAMGFRIEHLAFVFGAPIGVMLCDELWVRRGKVWLEELYLFRSQYGPSFSLNLAGLAAVSLGWMLQATLWPSVGVKLPVEVPVVAAWLRAGYGDVVGYGLACVVGAIAYWVFRPLEDIAARGVGWSQQRIQARRIARRRPKRICGEETSL